MEREIKEIVENRVRNFVDVLYEDLKDTIQEDFKGVTIEDKINPTYQKIKEELSQQMFYDLLKTVRLNTAN